MGLAISLVSKVKEKVRVPPPPHTHTHTTHTHASNTLNNTHTLTQVWYHKCPNRGRGCYNTQLLEDGGCAIWYNEQQYLADIQEHLGVTIPEVQRSFDVPQCEYDGKVRLAVGGQPLRKCCYTGHVTISTVSDHVISSPTGYVWRETKYRSVKVQRSCGTVSDLS